ncbi:hypothetical protein XELAEV_18001987mg [Xenopus laevis]|nr:hypothetical protein XELAEV_18001987mg [Xenopus laevis]
MAGIKGVKSRILEKYPQAIFCPCAAQALNLVGVHAASSFPEVKTFFGSVNRLYVLFSNSPEKLLCFDESNKILQARSVSMEIEATNIRALAEEMKSLREKWPALLSEARLVADGMEIPAELMNTQQIR